MAAEAAQAKVVAAMVLWAVVVTAAVRWAAAGGAKDASVVPAP